MSSKINKAWHERNKMPENATMDQRIQWHLAHQENCSCREMPDTVKREIEKRKKEDQRNH